MSQKFPYDQILLLIVLSLVGFGLVMVFSASSLISRDLFGSPMRIFVRQLISIILGIIVLLITMKIDYHTYQRREIVYPLLVLSLALLLVPLMTSGTHGARRWISLGPVNFQPAELAKLIIILFTSHFLVSYREKTKQLGWNLLPCLGVIALTVTLVLIEPDLGTAACIAATTGLLLYLGGLRYRFILAVTLLVCPFLYLFIVRVPYRLNRILAFLNPADDPYGIGYQIRQSLIAIGAGRWEGLGFAQGKQKLFFIPEPHTDFIFAVIGEEFGFVGSLALLVLFTLLLWRGVRVSLRADTLFGSFLGLGIVWMIVLQAFLNISVVIHLLPTKGIPLPFISVGGSSMLVMLGAIGILLNISSYQTASWKFAKP